MRFLHSWRRIALALLFTLLPISSFAAVSIAVTIAPPPLPIYEQPLCPEAGWMWTPGYWAYGDDGYYWVPGEWVPAPFVGALWTPPYWGWSGGQYVFNPGYWGTQVGYYGGIDYGFGYMGVGFVGGEWRSGAFAYNTAVVHVNRNVIHNTYVNETVVHRDTIANTRHVDYSGGPSGIRHDPTSAERAAMNERHQSATSIQQQHIEAARADRTAYAKANGGHPHTLAMARPATPEKTAGAAAAHEPAHTAANTHTTTHPAPESHAAPAMRNEPQSAHTAPHESRPVTEPRTETHATTVNPAPHESRPAETTHPETRPETETHPSYAARPETHEAPAAHEGTEARPMPESKPEIHPVPAPAPREEARPEPESHSAPAVHPESESHSAPEEKPEMREAPAPSVHTSRPEAAVHPAPESHAEHAPRPETHAAQSRHTAPPAAHAAHEAPPAHEEKPRN